MYSNHNLWSCQKVCDALIYLLHNIFIRFGTKLYRQIIGIPMRTKCAPLVADLFVCLLLLFFFFVFFVVVVFFVFFCFLFCCCCCCCCCFCFCFLCERDFMKSLSRENQADIIEAFN